MNKIIITSSLLLIISACDPAPPSAKDIAAAKGESMAENALGNGNNAEQKNIQRRLKLTGQPGLIGYVVLLNDMGKPVMYTTVKGKLTSGGKRLTQPQKDVYTASGHMVMDAPSDEGTWGSSSPYIYFWDTNDRYHQWSGQYLYSDQPIRLNEEPLVINLAE